MRNSQNVWIDGTLKHGDYFAKVFREVRRAHPVYAAYVVGKPTIATSIVPRGRRTPSTRLQSSR